MTGLEMRGMKDMVMVKPPFQMVTPMKECMKMVNGMVKECTGIF